MPLIVVSDTPLPQQDGINVRAFMMSVLASYFNLTSHELTITQNKVDEGPSFGAGCTWIPSDPTHFPNGQAQEISPNPAAWEAPMDADGTADVTLTQFTNSQRAYDQANPKT